LAPQIGDPALPHVSPETFEYHHLDECLVFELNGDNVPTWYRCTATNLEYAVEGEVGVLYITESSDQLAAYEWAQNDPDFTEESSVLTEIVGGGIIYMPDSWIWISDDPEYWDHFNAIDTDCPPFPETYPGTC